MNLLDKLLVHDLIGYIGIILSSDAHGRVLENGDIGAEVADELGRVLAFFRDRGGEFTGVILDILGAMSAVARRLRKPCSP